MTSITLPHNVDPSPLFLPPQLVPASSSINRLAVYGTLRDDDDSGASWTSSFIANRTSACSGIVRGAKLYWAHKLKSATQPSSTDIHSCACGAHCTVRRAETCFTLHFLTQARHLLTRPSCLVSPLLLATRALW